MIERVCDKCGKVFCPAPYHVYKEGSKIYCSWHCYNHRNDGKKKAQRKYVEIYNQQGELLKRFKSAQDASIATGFDLRSIQEACRSDKEYYGFVWKYKDEGGTA